MKTTRGLAVAVTLAFASGAAAAPVAEMPSKPRHVMSLNLCTDQLVLQLLSPERITSVTYLSRASQNSFLTAEAFGVPINYGTSEEVLQENPDLVIAGATSTPAVRALLKKVGVHLLEVPAADSFAEIRTITRLVAHAVGEEEIGESMIRHMDLTLSELAATSPKRRIVVAGWDGGGNVPAKGTLFDAILTAAGGTNVAGNITTNIVYGQYTAFDLEQLVAMRPDILAYGRSRTARLDLTTAQLQHRVVRKLYTGRQITYPETLYSCGLPQSADAARDLRRAMLSVMSKEPAP